MMSVVSPGVRPFTRSSLGVMATASAMVGLATDTRWILTGLSTTRDLPTVTDRSFVTSPEVSCGGSAAEGAGACSVDRLSARTYHAVAERRTTATANLVVILFLLHEFLLSL